MTEFEYYANDSRKKFDKKLSDEADKYHGCVKDVVAKRWGFVDIEKHEETSTSDHFDYTGFFADGTTARIQVEVRGLKGVPPFNERGVWNYPKEPWLRVPERKIDHGPYFITLNVVDQKVNVAVTYHYDDIENFPVSLRTKKKGRFTRERGFPILLEKTVIFGIDGAQGGIRTHT